MEFFDLNVDTDLVAKATTYTGVKCSPHATFFQPGGACGSKGPQSVNNAIQSTPIEKGCVLRPGNILNQQQLLQSK